MIKESLYLWKRCMATRVECVKFDGDEGQRALLNGSAPFGLDMFSML